MILPTLPVYKVQESYVFHHNDQSEVPLRLNAKPGEQGIVVRETENGLVGKRLQLDNYKELVITHQGAIEQK